MGKMPHTISPLSINNPMILIDIDSIWIPDPKSQMWLYNGQSWHFIENNEAGKRTGRRERMGVTGWERWINLVLVSSLKPSPSSTSSLVWSCACVCLCARIYACMCRVACWTFEIATILTSYTALAAFPLQAYSIVALQGQWWNKVRVKNKTNKTIKFFKEFSLYIQYHFVTYQIFL